jgi:phage-related protein (TIGR01555 family)
MAKKKATKKANSRSRSKATAKPETARKTKRQDSAPATSSDSPPASIYSGTNNKRQDGWKNVLTTLGTMKDKRQASTFVMGKKLDDNQLTAIWRANGLGRRIIDVIPDDVTRNWFTITNDEEDKVKQKLEELGAQSKINLTGKLGRCYGGAIAIIGVNDGQDLEEPVNEERIKSVDWITVFDRREVTIQSTDMEKDITTGNFGEPRIYEVIPRFGAVENTNASGRFRVHESRVIRFDGNVLAWREYEANGYWMDSILEHIYESIRQLGAVYDSAEFITESFVTTVLKVKNLMQLISAGNDSLIQRRLNLLDMSRHVANTELLDADEELTKLSSTVSGLAELLDRVMMAVSASTGIPVTKLFGRSPAGQNATGEGDASNYNDEIRAIQRNEYGPKMEKLVRYIFKSDGFGEPDQWSLDWNPLHELTQQEQADQYKATAEGDAIYIQNQVLDPDVIGRYRFIGDHFNAKPPSMTEEEFFEFEEERKEEERKKAEAAALAAEQFKANAGAVPPNAGDKKIPPVNDDDEMTED